MQLTYIKNTLKLAVLLLVIASDSIAEQLATAEPTDYQQAVLSAHNKIRARHHAPHLIWDNELARYAEQYALRCEFKHSGSHYGENLAAGYPSVFAAVQAWYAEEKHYSYTQPGFSYRTGHFTQLVWRGSKKVGCGYVICNGKHGTPGHYLVCEYSPAGNIARREYFIDNVLPIQ